MKLHTAAAVVGTFWLGSLLAVVVGPHPSIAHLAVYAWLFFLAMTTALGAVMLVAAFHVVDAMLGKDDHTQAAPPDFNDSEIRWLDHGEQPNPRVRAGS